MNERDAYAAGFWAGRFFNGVEDPDSVDDLFDEWVAARAEEGADRLARMHEFLRWTTSDRDIKMMGAAVCRERGYNNLGELAEQEPELFDELHEAARDLREQAPPLDQPGFM